MSSGNDTAKLVLRALRKNSGTLPGWASTLILGIATWLIVGLVNDIKRDVRESTAYLHQVATQVATNTANITNLQESHRQ